MGDGIDSSIASLSAILDESLLDASTSEATEVQSHKGTKSTVKTTRKGKTSAAGSLALITPVVTENKSEYDNYNQSLTHDSDEGNGSESELKQTDTLRTPWAKRQRKKQRTNLAC